MSAPNKARKTCARCGNLRSLKRKSRKYYHPKCRTRRKDGVKRVVPRSKMARLMFA